MKQSISEEEIHRLYEKGSTEIRAMLERMFPKLEFKVEDKYLDLSEATGRIDLNGIGTILEIRTIGQFYNKSLWLRPHYNWEILEDEYGAPCLIPTKK